MLTTLEIISATLVVFALIVIADESRAKARRRKINLARLFIKESEEICFREMERNGHDSRIER